MFWIWSFLMSVLVSIANIFFQSPDLTERKSSFLSDLLAPPYFSGFFWVCKVPMKLLLLLLSLFLTFSVIRIRSF